MKYGGDVLSLQDKKNITDMNNRNNLDSILYGVVCVIATWVVVGYLVMGVCKLIN